MKKILTLLSVIALLIISGYYLIFGFYPDQPPRTAADAWEKSDADKLEVKKALLECGIGSFSNSSSERDLSAREKINAQASVDACMVQAGFRNKFGESSWCENERYKADNLPICQPDAVIPQRSVEMRLNSPYCQENKDQPECQP
ncbi:hypothetical protein [Bartonella doshiae]|uniref:Uncharacterized protein n=2 Tax=Bartonella doshiae TaxID=33044 RepID=A0A380ZEQ0_BARDO|nr:hypothetical protein [Bartonella doshiae]EJF79065.1 hypothetical protein MCS_01510 [Bartonella doshiae NCTC 12862 = ATCC 700133]MBB6159864.1 hypothetical protein [Bartonella doshiae]SUV45457.1 Uncharacterised protein [Bartonella doshiae]